MLLRIRKSLLILMVLWMMAGQMPLTRTRRDPGQYSAENSQSKRNKSTRPRDNPSYQDHLFQQNSLALGRSIEPMEMVDNVDQQAREHWNMLRLFPENPLWEERELNLKNKYGPYSEYLWQAASITKSLKYNRKKQPILPSGFKLVMRYQPPSKISHSASAANTQYRYFLN